jgi:hypothetical protein
MIPNHKTLPNGQSPAASRRATTKPPKRNKKKFQLLEMMHKSAFPYANEYIPEQKASNPIMDQPK